MCSWAIAYSSSFENMCGWAIAYSSSLQKICRWAISPTAQVGGNTCSSCKLIPGTDELARVAPIPHSGHICANDLSTIAQALKTCADELPSYTSSGGNLCSSCSSRGSPVSYPRKELARSYGELHLSEVWIIGIIKHETIIISRIMRSAYRNIETFQQTQHWFCRRTVGVEILFFSVLKNEA